MPTRSLLLSLVASGLSAQVPFDHLVVVTSSGPVSASGLTIVDPDSGAATRIRIAGTAVTQAVGGTVAFDATSANVVYTLAQLSASINSNVVQLSLTGNDATRSNVSVTLVNATSHTLRYVPGFGLLVLVRGNGPSLYLRDTAGSFVSQPTTGLLQGLASDAVAIGTMAYASSGASSTFGGGAIVEWDLAANTDRVVGNTYPPITALAALPPLLLAGDDTGTLHLISPATGVASPYLATGLGRIQSIAVDSAGRIFIATPAGAGSVVHWIGNLTQPVYSSNVVIDDLKACPSAAPTMLTYGTGCTGSNGLAPTFTYTGMPGLGSTFTAGVQNALSTTAGFLLLGYSRTADGSGPLPRDLAAVGMPGCTQYCAVLATVFAPVSGGAAALAILVPGRPALAGLQVPMQWLLLDLPANALGATASNGAEAHLR